MTVNESVELLFRCRAEGGAEIDKLAASVREVSGAAVLSSDSISSLEKAIKTLTVAVNEHTAALAGLEHGYDGAAGGARRLGGGAREATAELRVLEGAMPIRAAGQLLSQMGALVPIMQAAFPIFGAIALAGVIDTIIQKVEKWANSHDPLIQAQNASLSILKESGKEYDRLRDKLHALQMDEYERAHGRDARMRLEGGESDHKASGQDANRIKLLGEYVRVLQQVQAFTPGGVTTTPGISGDPTMGAGGRTVMSGTELSAHQAAMLRAAGMEASAYDDKAVNPFDGIKAGNTLSKQQIAAAQTLLTKGVNPELQVAFEQQKVDSSTSGDKNARADADERKKAEEEAAKRKRDLQQIDKEASATLRQSQTFELSGLAKIGAAHEERLTKLREELSLLGRLSAAEQKRADADIQKENQAYGIEVKRELDRFQAQNRQAMGAVVADNEQGEARLDKYGDKAFLKKLKDDIEQETKDITAGLKVLQGSDESDAEGVRRGLGATIKGNTLAVRGGSMTGAQAATSDYGARLTASQEIFNIETQELSLIDDKDKREEKLAQARKKNADEIYQAEAQYQEQLEGLKEKDLEKYQQMASSLFDALHNHSTNQWVKNFAVGQERQVFSNAVSPILGAAGHALGSAIPNVGPLGTLLHGTVLDHANADPAQQTAQHTKDTADQVIGLRGDLKGIFTGNPDPNAQVGGGAAGGPGSIATLSGIPWIPGGGNPLATFGTDITGGWGQGSTSPLAGSPLFNAGNGSGITQFMSGLGGMGSNPLQAVFGGVSTNGGTMTELTPAQQAGAAVGTGAMLAGGALSIVSGIEQGGVGGYGKAAASGLGIAAALDPEPISKSILGSVAAITGLITGMFSTGPQQRTQQITDDVMKNQYLAPTALNVTQGMNGTYEDFDARGNLRTSSLSAVPTVAEPYITKRVINGQQNWYDVPGQATAPFSGGATGSGQAPVAGGITINVNGNLQAMDTESFHDFVRKPSNSNSLGESFADHLERHDGRASNAIRFVSQ